MIGPSRPSRRNGPEDKCRRRKWEGRQHQRQMSPVKGKVQVVPMVMSGHHKRSKGRVTSPRVSGQGTRAARPSQIKQRQRLKKARLPHDQGVQVRWEVPREPERRGAGRRDCPKTKRQGRDNPVPRYERTKVDKDSNPAAGCRKALPLQGWNSRGPW